MGDYMIPYHKVCATRDVHRGGGRWSWRVGEREEQREERRERRRRQHPHPQSQARTLFAGTVTVSACPGYWGWYSHSRYCNYTRIWSHSAYSIVSRDSGKPSEYSRLRQSMKNKSLKGFLGCKGCSIAKLRAAGSKAEKADYTERCIASKLYHDAQMQIGNQILC